MEEWESIFGERPPAGYDFDTADLWAMETWLKLIKEAPDIAYKLGIVFELSRREMIKRGVDQFCRTPYTYKLLAMPDKELESRLLAGTEKEKIS